MAYRPTVDKTGAVVYNVRRPLSKLLLQAIVMMPKEIMELETSLESVICRAWKYKNASVKYALFNDVTRDSIANNFVIDVYCRCL